MNIIWLKRDLRTLDNEALFKGLKKSALLVYIFEPSVSYNYDWDIRHWRFIQQSLCNLEKNGFKVHRLYGEANQIFNHLKDKYKELNIYSHCETGNEITYQRDLELKSLSKP